MKTETLKKVATWTTRAGIVCVAVAILWSPAIVVAFIFGIVGKEFGDWANCRTTTICPRCAGTGRVQK